MCGWFNESLVQCSDDLFTAIRMNFNDLAAFLDGIRNSERLGAFNSQPGCFSGNGINFSDESSSLIYQSADSFLIGRK
jgi:hypothetical protein